MTYNCEELFDDDVETIEYRPRSYIEEIPDFSFESNLPVKLDGKSKSTERISSPKRGSFSDLRNTILTKVGTPRGNRRSKTLIQRCQSAGESLKTALARTSSLDVLGQSTYKKDHHHSTDDEIMQGFSKLSSKTMIDSGKISRVQFDFTKDADKSYPKNKDRSNSCPTSQRSEDARTVRKTASCDSENYTCKVTKNEQSDQLFPTIKIELCPTINSSICAKSVPLQRKQSKWSSTGSLVSNNTDDDSSSDNSSVFASEISINGHIATILEDKGKKSSEVDKVDSYSYKKKRPLSLLAVFKRDKDEFSHCNTLPLPRKNINKTTDCNCNSLNSTTNKAELKTEVIEYDSDDDILECRVRATSMVELGDKNKLEKKRNNTLNNIKHERVKKTTSNIYGLASPATLKRLFKKKSKRVPAVTEIIAPLTPTMGVRRCIHIESLL